MTEHKHHEPPRKREHNLLTALVIVVLILSLLNIYGTFTLRSKFLDLVGDAQPAAAGPEAPSGPAPRIQASADDDAVKGQSGAKVTIIEFSDYECPFCGRFYTQTLPQIEEKYVKTGKVKMVFRDLPLSFHKQAQKAAEAAECAGEQGKYWEMHDKLFDNQRALEVANLKQYAKDLSLDTGKFDKCLDEGQMANEVKKDLADGGKYGVTGTPAFFINGIKVVGAQPFEVFEQIIEDELSN